MIKLIRMIIEKEAPIGLSSLGLYKTRKSEMARKLRNISGLSPIFNFDYKNFSY